VAGQQFETEAIHGVRVVVAVVG